MSDETTFQAARTLLRILEGQLSENEVEDFKDIQLYLKRIERSMPSPDEFNQSERTQRCFESIRNLLRELGLSPIAAQGGSRRNFLHASWVVSKHGCPTGTDGGCSGNHCNGKGMGCGKCGHSYGDGTHDCKLVFAEKPEKFEQSKWDEYKENIQHQRWEAQNRLVESAEEQ
tara:strand:- start:437 stop:952 length:516 start_codon:yes stop_codon:yes gene_type:complete